MYDPSMDDHQDQNHQNPFAERRSPYPEYDIGDARSRPPVPPVRPLRPVTLYDPPSILHAHPAPLRTSSAYASQPAPQQPSHDAASTSSSKWQPMGGFVRGFTPKGKISKKWQKRLYWIVPLCIITIVFAVLFEIYKDDFERWMQPVSDWLEARESWSWTIPTAILVILSFPPLFGHEIVQLIVGLAYPLGVALGVACAGGVIGEAACFVVFKYLFTGWVEKKIAQKVNWAATARVTQEAGFRGVLVIRYSIVPPHIANPLFACTGMKFWLYMATVILSLPKSMVFVALGSPSSKNSKTAKYGKVAAIVIVVIITIFASMWIRKKMTVATRKIMVERGIALGGSDEELVMMDGDSERVDTRGETDTSYKGVVTEQYVPYQGDIGVAIATPHSSQPGAARYA
ncbi:uncharacterized protein L3040_002680 [Drepanopeziza brunnea f. sp. 'multigermtubi']|uniref:uncharacterized protein n=1 Tax=Drepanopeziza brunnea f. sp. 'multigermtubi' TaxID=698441 RepID=UPI002388676C|nr:hypothetical protein L3040_002680 [Drepanopeziza brunnea f. sp. 'multigermtubi']